MADAAMRKYALSLLCAKIDCVSVCPNPYSIGAFGIIIIHLCCVIYLFSLRINPYALCSPNAIYNIGTCRRRRRPEEGKNGRECCNQNNKHITFAEFAPLNCFNVNTINQLHTSERVQRRRRRWRRRSSSEVASSGLGIHFALHRTEANTVQRNFYRSIFRFFALSLPVALSHPPCHVSFWFVYSFDG